ncbi:MAG: IS21 family transposase [Acidobacteriota bacterium]
MSQWAEIRHMHLVDGIPKKQIARRLELDVKTVRRAIERPEPPARAAVPRCWRLDPWREQIEGWLLEDCRLTAKRIRRLLIPLAGPIPGRTVRRYVAKLKAELYPREAYVHRSAAPGVTMEVDFGESWAVVGGELHKVKYLVATLPYSNVYFAKAYPIERLESLLDGIQEAFRYFGGVVERVVLDNTSIAVKKVLMGRDRELTEAFDAFRGAYPFAAEFCAPAKGWEKGSVETGVKYVRNNVFLPMPQVESWNELNELIIQELEADLEGRRLEDGRTVREAWAAERQYLRALPAHRPETCRVVARVADKFGNVKVDRVSYSVPIRHAYRPVWVRAYHDRVEIAAGAEVVARHERSFREGAKVIEPLHVLPLLERKHRAVNEATALQGWKLPKVFLRLRDELRKRTRKPDREWIRVLRLMENHSEHEVEAAVVEALESGSPRLETVRLLLRRRQQGEAPEIRPAPVQRTDLAAITVPAPELAAYDALSRTS